MKDSTTRYVNKALLITTLLLFSACFEVDGTTDNMALLNQSVNKQATAVVVTNTNADISGTSENPGTIAIDTGLDRKESISITPSPSLESTHPIRGNPLLDAPESPVQPQSATRNYLQRPAAQISYQDRTHTFTAYDSNQDRITVEATLQYGSEDSHCLIYLQDDALDGAYSLYDFELIGTFFDETVYPEISRTFAPPTDVDNNNKIIILYYDMESTSILGFFYSVDLYSQESLDENYGAGRYISNEMELFYMNIRWAAPGHEEMKRTLAHEFQHMVTFGYRTEQRLPMLETWIDEGLAESAEHLVCNTPGTFRIEWMNKDPYHTIRNGLSLMVWEKAIGNYSLAYTFMQYVRIQSGGGNNIYSQIARAPQHNHEVFEDALSGNSSLSSFSRILRAYRLANILQQNQGIFGYKDENDIFDITVPAPSQEVDTISLKPGGSIAVPGSWYDIESLTDSNAGEHIIYSKVRNGTVKTF